MSCEMESDAKANNIRKKKEVGKKSGKEKNRSEIIAKYSIHL